MATCNFFQDIKASVKYFIFKDIENNSLPRGPKCDAFHRIHKGLRYSYFLPQGMLFRDSKYFVSKLFRSWFTISRSHLTFPVGIFEIPSASMRSQSTKSISC